MTAQLVPFPATRRVGLIGRMARQMASYRPDAAERTLWIRLDATRSAMLRKGIAPGLVDREIRSLELAIRAKLWMIVMQGGDVA